MIQRFEFVKVDLSELKTAIKEVYKTNYPNVKNKHITSVKDDFHARLGLKDYQHIDVTQVQNVISWIQFSKQCAKFRQEIGMN